ncbi:hypothetical protein DFP72DRAFT_882182 [Ephemerocybe angulata]|uniref:Uncharacterized protein n=1 Tax=Ephemerocybe angulata TaxID=980116 RepID=A0A8H6I8B6_9AGAR|nr:hypothetical protein DFP72DRAFT_882182 [Tulosesus angulatus]
MEPLLDLAVLNSWDEYTPSKDGYTPPTLSELEDIDIFESLRCLERLEPQGIIAAGHAYPSVPPAGIFIKDHILHVPLVDSDVEVLLNSNELAGTREKLVEIDSQKIQIENPKWKGAVARCIKAALGRAKMEMQPESYTFNLVGLTLLVPPSSGAYSLDLRPVSDQHFATVLIVLPSSRKSASIEARHRGLTATHDFTPSSLFAPHFVVLHTGIETATIKSPDDHLCYLTYHLIAKSPKTPLPSLKHLVSGPRPDVAKAIAGWAYALATGSKGPGIPTGCLAYHLDGTYSFTERTDPSAITHPKDKLVLGHLAPAAKLHGFRILFAHADVSYTSYFDEFEDDGMPTSAYELENGYDQSIDFEWELAGLDGREVQESHWEREIDAILSEKTSRKVHKNDAKAGRALNYHLDKQSFYGEKDVEGSGHSEDVTTMCLTLRKQASFLVIGPGPGVWVKPDDPVSPPPSKHGPMYGWPGARRARMRRDAELLASS